MSAAAAEAQLQYLTPHFHPLVQTVHAWHRESVLLFPGPSGRAESAGGGLVIGKGVGVRPLRPDPSSRRVAALSYGAVTAQLP